MAKASLHHKSPSDENKNLTGHTQKALDQEPQAETQSVYNVINTPHKPTPSSIHLLQRTVGNRAVQRLVEKEPQPAGGSAVIQRHIGSVAEANGNSALDMLNQTLTNVSSSLGTVSMAQHHVMMLQSMGRAEPISEAGEHSEGRSEGHGYEFDDDVLE